METPEPSSAKFKLGRWLLLLSAFTVALGSLIWWKSQDEQLRFVKPIWSSASLNIDTYDQASNNSQQVGELWEHARSRGLLICGRGHIRCITGQYPVFPKGNRFQQGVSEVLLEEQRQMFRDYSQGDGEYSESFDLSMWWKSASFLASSEPSTFDELCEVLFVGECAVSIKTSATGTGVLAPDSGSYYATCFRNFVDREGRIQELKIGDLFRPGDWVSVVSDLCIADLRRQKSRWVQEPARGAWHPHKERLDLSNLDEFTLNRVGITFHFRRSNYGADALDRDYVVLIPYEKLTAQLLPDGPHRQVQGTTNK